MKTILTSHGARLKPFYSNGSDINWLFIPGGPGLGSESLIGLVKLLQNKIPGNLWLFDFPNDGSNLLEKQGFEHWDTSLVEAVKKLGKTIIVAHSTGGMLVQSIPELQDLLHALVLLDSAPDSSWQDAFSQYVNQHRTAEIERLEQAYENHPSNEALRALLIATTGYSFSEKALNAGIKLFEQLPINYKAMEWAKTHFDPNYKAKWISSVPTLIMAGEQDLICPLSLFNDRPEYQKGNICFKSIAEAGHYPWIDNPEELCNHLVKFSKFLPK